MSVFRSSAAGRGRGGGRGGYHGYDQGPPDYVEGNLYTLKKGGRVASQVSVVVVMVVNVYRGQVCVCVNVLRWVGELCEREKGVGGEGRGSVVVRVAFCNTEVLNIYVFILIQMCNTC